VFEFRPLLLHEIPELVKIKGAQLIVYRAGLLFDLTTGLYVCNGASALDSLPWMLFGPKQRIVDNDHGGLEEVCGDLVAEFRW
jgi:hypothetical protein